MKNLITGICCLILSHGFAQIQSNIDVSKIDVAKKMAAKFLDSEQIPGMSISVSKDGKVIWSEGFGYSNIETKKKVEPSNTQFRIASISKSLTAAALAKLMDDGKMNLDKSVYTYLPDYPKKQYDFTIRQIGGHLAGIRHYKGREFVLNKKMSITEGLDIFKDEPLLHQPGSRYRYSTYGWNLLSEVVQVVAKTPFNDYMKNHIFRPLNMINTTLDLSDSRMPNRTTFYNKKSDQIIHGPAVSNEHKVAGGGFLSTSEDLVNFGNDIIAPKVLERTAVAELLTPQKTDDGKSTNYGVGFAISKTWKGTPKYAHSGGGIGASTMIMMYPEENVVIVVLTNLSNAPVRDFSKKLERIFIE